MKVNRDDSELLDEMISTWEEDGLINKDTSEKLRKSYETKSFDWRRLAQYSFWIALACGVIALGSVLVDKQVLSLIEHLYYTPNAIISLVSACIACWLFFISIKRKKQQPKKIFSNEAYTFAAVMLTANSIAYFGKAVGGNSMHFSLLILLSVFLYGGLALFFSSRLIWVFALISLGAWFGTETGYLSRWSWYFMGLNYPLRFVFFGMLITSAALFFRKKNFFSHFYPVTYIGGMVYLFVSLWLLSVFGNYGNLEEWYSIKQISLFYWAIISALACSLAIWCGLRYNDSIAREFGITFLFLNLYTRYFEYFWDSWHKALFFAVLALSFWLIGRKAEKIWNLEIFK
ncbi:MAG: DUF2157 domain-containing protein [Sphingobacteriales bacterium]|nr:MAG: DUF2157 domain-containing protein [Sphingobacteriales bacterium]